MILGVLLVSSGGLTVRHLAFGAKDHRFDPSKRSKLFLGLISPLTTSWCPEDDLLVKKISTHHLFDIYNVKALPTGLAYTVKTRSQSAKSSPAIESYFIREDEATRYLNDLIEGLTAKILAFDVKLATAVQEDLSGYETLWHRIIDQSRVDHGITCCMARLLAQLHRVTSSLHINKDKQKEIQQIFRTSTVSELSVEQAFTKLLQIDSLGADLDQEVRTAAESTMRQPHFVATVNAVKEIYASNRKCVIHGNINLCSIIIKDQLHIKFVDFGYAQMGPGTYDLGTLVAGYMTAYYVHILTEEDSSSHRQVAHCMLDSVRKTIDTYLEQVSASGTDEQYRITFFQEVTAFTAIQLITRALNSTSCSDCDLSANVRVNILQSGHRLLSKYSAIDNVFDRRKYLAIDGHYKLRKTDGF
ncbi:hypothetical protein LSH36_97g07081 [Paralvinella palmiformis]|uniref:Aminoglycoside phosphotransferase domain-containing protein n=1 Tax=Paralvinella palmiformis TaxID=53620 RepID=A0AAD9NBW6_9ANNE|nr:hypothetical protein LSH36_97g07081 [Paralvinella palmiformis]